MTLASATAPRPVAHKPRSTKTIVAISIGNALEWFDLAVYGFLALTISRVFFPVENEGISLLLTLATFGVSFVMRPLGSIIIGSYADRAGRKKALSLSITLMMVGTFIIAIAPTYAMVGIAAPIIIVIARLIQGFSAGGEFGSATAYLAELNPERRGLYSSWQFASQGLVTIFASGFGVFLNTALNTEQLESWGWRLPFFFGLLIGPVAIYIRRQLKESEEFTQTGPQETATPLRNTIKEQKTRVLLSFGLVILTTIGSYTLLFLPSYAVRQLGIAAAYGFTATLLMGFIQLSLTPVFGHLSDRYGRTPIMIFASAAILIAIIPLFMLLTGTPNVVTLHIVLACLAVAMAGYAGPLSAAMSELFPTKMRGTGLSISYSFAVTIFGGFAPFIIAWLINVTGSNISPAYYLTFGAAVSLITLLLIRKAAVPGLR